MKNRLSFKRLGLVTVCSIAVSLVSIPADARCQTEQRSTGSNRTSDESAGSERHRHGEQSSQQRIQTRIATVGQEETSRQEIEVRVRQIEEFEFEDLRLNPEQTVDMHRHVHEVQLIHDGMFETGEPFVATNQYWIGVDCVPASPSLRVQLQLQHGLVVEAIAPDSPASRAGLQPYDVLVDYAGESLGDVDELIEVIQEAGEVESNVKYMRQGRIGVVSLKAEPRLQEFHTPSVYKIQTIVDDGADSQPIQQTLTQWTQAGDLAGAGDGILRMMVVRPGIVVESEDVELERRVEFGDGHQLRLVGTPGNPLRMVYREGEANAITLDNAGDVERVPVEYRGMVLDAAKRFHWHEGPVQIGEQQLSLFPQFTFAAAQDGATESTQFQIVVDATEEEPIAERPPFRVRSIEIRDRLRNRGLPQLDEDAEVSLEQQERLAQTVIRRQRIELQRSVKQLEVELRNLQQRLEMLEQLEEQWSERK